MSTSRLEVQFVVPLLDFERSMIDDVQEYLRSHPDLRGDRGDRTEAFNLWKWSQKLQTVLQENLDTENESFRLEWGASRARAYEASFPMYENHDGHGRHRYRIMQMKVRNSKFLDFLGDRPASSIVAVPDPNDTSCWETLDAIVNAFGRPWDTPEKMDSDFGLFDVFRMVRIFFVHSYEPFNAGRIGECLNSHPKFLETFTVERLPGPEDSLRTPHTFPGFTHRIIKKKQEPGDNLPGLGRLAHLFDKEENMKITEEDLILMFTAFRQNRQYVDPGAYLRYIAWDELEIVPPEQLGNSLSGIDYFLPRPDAVHEWATWIQPNSGFSLHNLHVEDEIFQYMVNNKWQLPCHSIDGRIIFLITPLSESQLIPGLGQFWLNWNDCAITRDEAGIVYVLETIPGLRFRGRAAKSDRATSVNHHRAMVESHTSGSLDKTHVKDLLGLEAGYTPLFEHSLKIIAEEQLSPIDWKKPLGKGANGAVYVSKWTRPKGVLSTSESGEVDVVLKMVIPNESEQTKALGKFMKELDSTYASLGSVSSACVQFFGLTQIKALDMIGTELLFVFERATQGTVSDFLDCHLRDLDFYSSWKELIDCLTSIATGISFIHAHGVVHRDLHLNNILVTDRFYPNDVELPHEYSYLISDLGEGKRLTQQQDNSTNGKPIVVGSYGAVSYRAPEILERTIHSPTFASEVYSFGIMARKLYERRVCVNNSEPTAEVKASAAKKEAEVVGKGKGKEEISRKNVVPKDFREVVLSCLAYCSSERPTMDRVCRMLDDLTVKFTSQDIGLDDQEHKLEWCIWDWNVTGADAQQEINSGTTDGFSDFPPFEF